MGLIAGAVLYGFTYREVGNKLLAIANLGNVVLPDLWRVNPYLLVLAFSLVVLFLFYLLEHGLSRKSSD